MSSQGPTAQIGGSPTAAAAADLAGLIENYSQRIDLVRRQLGQVIFGQEQTVEQALISILSGGHVLLIGVPGLAKTKLVDSLGQVLGVDAQRVQCTPDLMPSDIVGSEVLEESESGRRSFRFIKGPVFCQLLMADEINRASPRTQSALLQAMQERKVSVAGHTYNLPEPFHVLATQNPLEQEGTYPLPEAQLDRFLLQIDVDYPSPDAERQMLIVTTGSQEAGLTRVLSPEDVLSIQRLVRRMPVGEKVVDAILKMVRAGRPELTGIKEVKEGLAWGPGPRAGQALMLATRARALIQGRFSPSIDDVMALAHPVLRHRFALTYGARAEGATPRAIIDRLIAEIG
ncbi:AAA family ATPase [Dongia deserti]|uniref:AAA family ATPase n=1 Tax=Dongia deserti TaxID=2268030 RepID=UPI000E64AD15|nr:MoxR family ATPase [Dongia deserti]